MATMAIMQAASCHHRLIMREDAGTRKLQWKKQKSCQQSAVSIQPAGGSMVQFPAFG
jgi:hypothetical protein